MLQPPPLAAGLWLRTAALRFGPIREERVRPLQASVNQPRANLGMAKFVFARVILRAASVV
jgi:hypothetical protein